MRKRLTFVLIAFLVCIGLKPADAKVGVQLQLLQACNLPGNFLRWQSLYADADRVYAASFQGKLYVLARGTCAVLREIYDTALPLTAVRGDRRFIYTVGWDRLLRVYDKRTLEIVETLPLSGFATNALGVARLGIYTVGGEAAMEVDNKNLYLSQLNPGEVAVEIGSGRTYGQTFTASTTRIFDQRDATLVGTISNPTDIFGRLTQMAIYPDDGFVALTMPGCCGQGIFLYSRHDWGLTQFIPWPFTNVVVRQGKILIAGNESGAVAAFDLGENPSPMISSLDLRGLTGNNGAEDIEIRSLWADHALIFAASSWNGRLTTPSLFILRLAK